MTFTFQRCYKGRTTTLFAVKVALTEVKSHLNLVIFAFQKTAFHFFVVSLSDINNKMRARTTRDGARTSSKRLIPYNTTNYEKN